MHSNIHILVCNDTFPGCYGGRGGGGRCHIKSHVNLSLTACAGRNEDHLPIYVLLHLHIN